MGVIDRLIQPFMAREERSQLMNTYFKVVNAYSPVFTTFSGGVYEMELTRAAIHTFATHASKASPIIKGAKYKRIEAILKSKPNDIMTASQFLYKVASIFEAENNCFLIPIYEDKSAGKIVGLYPVRGQDTKIVRLDNGKLMLRYKVNARDGTPQEYAIPYEEVGHLRNHFYRRELYGESNSPLAATMNLLSTQQQAIINSVEQSATIRFMAKLSNMLKPEDLKKEQQRLRDLNLSTDNNGGIFMYDAKYADVQQVKSSPFTVDAEQTKLIKDNVYSYFGISEDILQSKPSESVWESYYEAKLEPFLIQLSQVVTSMLFNLKDIEQGSMCIYEAQRLQYASAQTKLSLVTQLFDRGFITHNQGLEIFNLAPREDGDKYFIRREYAEVDKLDGPIQLEEMEGDA
jgi:hypothetical protein